MCRKTQRYLRPDPLMNPWQFSWECVDVCLCTWNIDHSKATSVYQPHCRAAGNLRAVSSGHTAPQQPLKGGFSGYVFGLLAKFLLEWVYFALSCSVFIWSSSPCFRDNSRKSEITNLHIFLLNSITLYYIHRTWIPKRHCLVIEEKRECKKMYAANHAYITYIFGISLCHNKLGSTVVMARRSRVRIPSFFVEFWADPGSSGRSGFLPTVNDLGWGRPRSRSGSALTIRPNLATLLHNQQQKVDVSPKLCCCRTGVGFLLPLLNERWSLFFHVVCVRKRDERDLKTDMRMRGWSGEWRKQR